ncbi:hypothetical protein BPAE_0005g01210 [Botrytis paeoniae]|uniref:Uncharacterized protein n=1 Tax=Botrytis paeoniae TaxID=278948 RepID=A0A4Z1G145_9HELO|nr:hypothetical protein BPAE_0005g01210 [Botrytis paeoniae]
MRTSYRNLVERCEGVKWTVSGQPFRKYKVLLELHVSLENKKKRCRERNAVVRVAYLPNVCFNVRAYQSSQYHMFLSPSRFTSVEGLVLLTIITCPTLPQLHSDPTNSAMAAMSIVHCPLRIDFLMSNCTGLPMAPESQNFIRSDS